MRKFTKLRKSFLKYRKTPFKVAEIAETRKFMQILTVA